MWKRWILIVGVISAITVAPFVYADNTDNIIPIVPAENALLVEQESTPMPMYKSVGEEETTRGVAPSPQYTVMQMLLLYVGIVVVTGYIIRFVFAEESGGQS